MVKSKLLGKTVHDSTVPQISKTRRKTSHNKDPARAAATPKNQITPSSWLLAICRWCWSQCTRTSGSSSTHPTKHRFLAFLVRLPSTRPPSRSLASSDDPLHHSRGRCMRAAQQWQSCIGGVVSSQRAAVHHLLRPVHQRHLPICTDLHSLVGQSLTCHFCNCFVDNVSVRAKCLLHQLSCCLRIGATGRQPQQNASQRSRLCHCFSADRPSDKMLQCVDHISTLGGAQGRKWGWQQARLATCRAPRSTRSIRPMFADMLWCFRFPRPCTMFPASVGNESAQLPAQSVSTC